MTLNNLAKGRTFHQLSKTEYYKQEHSTVSYRKVHKNTHIRIRNADECGNDRQIIK